MTNDKPSAGLKPCPFCASANVDPEGWATLPQYAKTPEERSGPACNYCGASAETVTIWNTRAAPPATGDVRRETIEECAKIADDFAAYEQTFLDRAYADSALSEGGREKITNACRYRQVAAEQIAYDIRALASVAPGPSKAAIQKSAPVILAPHNSGERDPAVTPDWAGADTEPGPRR